MCRWLLAHGALASARGEWNVTPLSVAVQEAPIFTVKLLLERCNGIQSGQLLHFAIKRDNEDVLEVVEILLNLGCPINSIMFEDDPRSWKEVMFGEPGSPLFAAAEMGKTDLVVFLLSRGADPLLPSKKGRTPLEAAESEGHTHIADILRQYDTEDHAFPAQTTDPELTQV